MTHPATRVGDSSDGGARRVSIGGDDDGYDTLTVNGRWTISLTVLGGGDINVAYSDGTTQWTFTDTCQASSPVYVPATRARD